MSTESVERINRLAQDVLRLSRNTLLVNMRYLDLALSQFQWIPIMESTYMTDGYHLLYNPSHVLRSYKSEKEAAVRDYLHITMHCIFKHMFMNPTINRPIWDLATDIAVENMITEFGLRSVSSFREKEQKKYISKIKDHVKILTAEKIYRFLLDQKLSLEESADWRGAFYADDHAIWYMTNDDVYVIERLDGYTVEQIDAFLKFAIEKGSTNCTAAFLSFKNDHFAEFAEVDEFTLDF